MQLQTILGLPTSNFLQAINHENFTNDEIVAIGDELIHRFPDQKLLEEECARLFGMNIQAHA